MLLDHVSNVRRAHVMGERMLSWPNHFWPAGRRLLLNTLQRY